MNKICTKCKENKPLSDYYRNINHKDDKQSACKSCCKKYDKTEKRKLTRAKANAKYEKTEKGKLTKVKYAKSDKGKITSTRKRKKYYKTDKGKALKARTDHNRRINISNSTNTLTVNEFNCILFLQNYQCANPNCEHDRFFDIIEPQKDHIYPVSKGGNFTKDTVQALCKSCDSKKGAQYIDYRSDYHKEIIATII
jgi:hypothetical protein